MIVRIKDDKENVLMTATMNKAPKQNEYININNIAYIITRVGYEYFNIFDAFFRRLKTFVIIKQL